MPAAAAPPLRLAGAALALALPGLAWADGGVMVRSEPPGQRIFVDGEETGLETPALVLGLPAGPHRFELTSGCRGGVGEAVVIDGKNVELTIQANLDTGVLQVNPNPPTAAVAVDGVEGPNKRSLSCGAHTVRVALPGFVQAVVPVEVEAGRSSALDVSLEPLGTGTLTLSLSPADAAVAVDGRPLAVGPVRQAPLTAGPHSLELSRAGYAPLQKTIVLEPGAELSLNLALQPLAPTAAATPPLAPGGGGMSKAQALRATGWGLTAAGVGAAVFGITRFAAAGAAYAEYQDRSLNGPGPASAVEAIRAEQVVPARNLGWTMSALGAALVGGGVTLAVSF
jgi:hypothetical protein